MLRRFLLPVGALTLALFAVSPVLAQTTMTVKTAPSGQVTSYTTTSTTFVPVDSTHLSFTVTIPTGYNLLINAAGNATTAGSSANNAQIALFDGSTALTSTYIYAYSYYPCPGRMTWVVAGNGAPHTIKLEYRANNAAYEAVIPYFTTQADGMLGPVMTFLMAPTT